MIKIGLKLWLRYFDFINWQDNFPSTEMGHDGSRATFKVEIRGSVLHILNLKHLLDIEVKMSRRQIHDLKFRGDTRSRVICLEVISILMVIKTIRVDKLT